MTLASQRLATEYLERVQSAGKVPPALLLFGPAGSGRAHLAHAFAARYLCLAEAPAARPCGGCEACRRMATLRHPDYIVFSSRDLEREARLLAAAAPVFEAGAARGQALALLHRVEARAAGGFLPLRRGRARGKTEADEGDSDGPPAREAAREFAEACYAAGRALETAADQAAVAAGLAAVAELAALVPAGVLPIDGVRAVIEKLGFRPTMSGRRVLLIEGIEVLRQEAANALLKTIEEPPAGTVIVLVAERRERVLPTILSRSALVPVRKIPAAGLEALARETCGLASPPPAEGAAGWWDYLERFVPLERPRHGRLVAFFDLVYAEGRDPGLFAFLGELVADGQGLPFLDALEDLLARGVLAREHGIGADALEPRMLDPFPEASLREAAAAARAAVRAVKSNNANPLVLLEALFMRFRRAAAG